MNQDWINPILFSLGPVQLHWYGALHVMAFVIGGLLLKYLYRQKFWALSEGAIDQYIVWLILAMFIGSRLFYVFIYNWDYYSTHLLEIFALWKGGMSFYGSLIAMGLVSWIFAQKHKLHFFQITDCLAIAGSQGILWGRIGNFINGELYGRVTDSWIGVIFPTGGPFPRHPSQLYEGILEGFVLFIILFYLFPRERFYGVISSLFLLGYGVLRFFVEFFREPDAQFGFYLKFFSFGQVLCILTMLFGWVMLIYARRLNIKNPLIPR